jgi:hypothetical protein
MSSLILTTANRIIRIVDRVREMLLEFEKLAHSEQPDETKRTMLFEDLARAMIRPGSANVRWRRSTSASARFWRRASAWPSSPMRGWMPAAIPLLLGPSA